VYNLTQIIIKVEVIVQYELPIYGGMCLTILFELGPSIRKELIAS
jgi:hypothetical protein